MLNGRLLAGVIAGLYLSHGAYAGQLLQDLNFTANESLWGPGGSSASFGASGSTSVGVVDLFEYRIGASAGTVNARHHGALQFNFDDALASAGTTTVGLSFNGDAGGGRLQTDLGAFITVDVLGLSLLDRDYGLNILETYTPTVPDLVSGSDSATGITASLDVFVAEAGVDFDVEQTSELTISALTGTLAYGLRGSGVTQLRSFSLSSSPLDLSFDLAQTGIWDFALLDTGLENLFRASYDLELVLFEEHFGQTGCITEVLGVCIVPRLGTVRNETTLADINVWNRDPFALAFANTNRLGGFSITVANGPIDVVAPSDIGMLLTGLLGLGLLRRQRAADAPRSRK